MTVLPRLIMERRGKLEDLDRSFDLQYWQAQSDTARFEAAWELVLTAQRMQGRHVRLSDKSPLREQHPLPNRRLPTML